MKGMWFFLCNTPNQNAAATLRMVVFLPSKHWGFVSNKHGEIVEDSEDSTQLS